MLQQLQPMVSAKVAALEAEATAKNCKWVSKGRGGGGGDRQGVGAVAPVAAGQMRAFLGNSLVTLKSHRFHAWACKVGKAGTLGDVCPLESPAAPAFRTAFLCLAGHHPDQGCQG